MKRTIIKRELSLGDYRYRSGYIIFKTIHYQNGNIYYGVTKYLQKSSWIQGLYYGEDGHYYWTNRYWLMPNFKCDLKDKTIIYRKSDEMEMINAHIESFF